MSEDHIELATVANQLSQQASLQASTQGVIFECLIGSLIENGTLSREDVKAIFDHAHELISESAKGSPAIEGTPQLQGMLQIVRNVAQGFGFKLPE